jgi:hypothetical protein
MTTLVWNQVINSIDDASFRAWGSDLSSRLASIGLIKTSDTGQINWTTVTRPAAGNFAGYEIWRFADSTIFMRWEYGSGSGSNQSTPAIRIAVGQGSNGSGTLTGAVTSTVIASLSRALSNATTPKTSYMCHTGGYFGFLGYSNYSAAPDKSNVFFSVCKTVDANGVFTNNGAIVYWNTQSGIAEYAPNQILNLATNTAMQLQDSPNVSPYRVGTYCMVPFNITSSLVGSDTQCFAHWMATPRVYPVIGVCTVVTNEVSFGSTFSTAIVGTTPRTYLGLDLSNAGAIINTFNNSGIFNYKLAMLWE